MNKLGFYYCILILWRYLVNILTENNYPICYVNGFPVGYVKNIEANHTIKIILIYLT
jgi:hypothetical protein